MAGDHRAWDVSWDSTPGNAMESADFSCAAGANITTEYTGEGTCKTELVAASAGGSPLSGKFALTISSVTSSITTFLDFNATAAQVRESLEALTGVAAAEVELVDSLLSGDRGGGSTYLVTFPGALGVSSPPGGLSLTASTMGLNGTGADATVREVYQGSRWGGEFALSIGGLEGSAVPFDARAEEMQEAINALVVSANGDGGDDGGVVEVWREDLEAGFRWAVAFSGGSLDEDIELMSVAWSELDGTDGNIRVYRQADGVDSPGGTFTLAFKGDVSEPLPWNANAASVEEALESLPQVGDVSVVATMYPGATTAVGQNSSVAAAAWTIEFTTVGTPANLGDLPLLQADGSFLTGIATSVSAAEISAGCCAVQVSANGGVDFTSIGYDSSDENSSRGNAAAFRYQDRATVHSVTPRAGPVSGGTTVLLSGAGFDLPSFSMATGTEMNPGGFVCVFGGRLESPAARLNSTTVECTSPSMPRGEPGPVSVAVRWPGSVSSSTTTAAFTFYEDVVLKAVSPRRGSNVGGYAASVSIGRGSFTAGGVTDVTCAIEVRLPSNLTGGYRALNFSLPAVEISSAEPEGYPGTVDVSERHSCGVPGLEDSFPEVDAEDWVDNDWGAVALVRLSGNGGADLTAPLAFTYFPTPSVTRALPALGVDGGGTSVVVYGTWLAPPDGGHDEADLLCRFGHTAPVPARYVSDGALACVSPPHANVAAVLSVLVESAHVFHAMQEVLLRVPSPTGLYPNTSSFILRSGTWTLSLEDFETYPLGANVTADEMAGALSALPNIGNASVAAENRFLSDPYTDLAAMASEGSAIDELAEGVFSFPVLVPEIYVRTVEAGNDGDGIVREVQVLRSNRSTASAEVQTITVVTGLSPTAEIQVVTLAANEALSGEFTVTYPGLGSTAPLAHDASSEVFASAIRALDAEDIIGTAVTVSRSRTGVRGYAWTVTFDDLSVGDRPQLVATANASLETRTAGGTLSLEVDTVEDGVAGIGGTFEIYSGSAVTGSGAEDFTGPLTAKNVSAREVEVAVEALYGIGDVAV
ncbi:unnamed protein product, partial [Hapterophycus canaliculatus]